MIGLHRLVWGSNLAGALPWLALMALFSWPLGLIGLAYVLSASLFFGVAYNRLGLTRNQESAVWTAPWVAAVLLWAWVLEGVSGDGGYIIAGAVAGTISYVIWQGTAFLIREGIKWKTTKHEL